MRYGKYIVEHTVGPKVGVIVKSTKRKPITTTPKPKEVTIEIISWNPLEEKSKKVIGFMKKYEKVKETDEPLNLMAKNIGATEYQKKLSKFKKQHKLADIIAYKDLVAYVVKLKPQQKRYWLWNEEDVIQNQKPKKVPEVKKENKKSKSNKNVNSKSEKGNKKGSSAKRENKTIEAKAASEPENKHELNVVNKAVTSGGILEGLLYLHAPLYDGDIPKPKAIAKEVENANLKTAIDVIIWALSHRHYLAAYWAEPEKLNTIEDIEIKITSYEKTALYHPSGFTKYVNNKYTIGFRKVKGKYHWISKPCDSKGTVLLSIEGERFYKLKILVVTL